MFVYGRSDEKCGGGKCTCWCETTADKDGNCTEQAHDGYNLYRFETESTKTSKNSSAFSLFSFRK